MTGKQNDEAVIGCVGCDRELVFGGCSPELMAVLGDKKTATAYAGVQMGWGLTNEGWMVCPTCLQAVEEEVL